MNQYSQSYSAVFELWLMEFENEKFEEFTFKSIEMGAKGLDMGRNFFQIENPVGIIKTVHGIIQDDLTEKEAMEVYNIKSAKLE